MEENENNFKSKIKKLLKTKNKAFYIALSVCLTCVGGAALSSINSWNQFNKPRESMEIKAPDKAKKENPLKKGVNETKEAAKPAKPSEQRIHDNKMKEQEKLKEKLNEKPNEKPPSEEKPKPTNAASKTKIVYPTSSKNVLKKFSGDTPVASQTMNDWRVHNGVDLEAEKDSVIKSITSGKVQSIKEDKIFGKIVIIEHSNGVLASYCGLENIKVKEGQSVTSEQELGTLGVIPSEAKENSHLHLTMQKDGKYINPTDILGS